MPLDASARSTPTRCRTTRQSEGQPGRSPGRRSDGDVKTFIDTTDGRLVMRKGEIESADVTLTTDYATARALFVDQDPQAAMQAFMSGKIKVQGDMSKLMMLQAGRRTTRQRLRQPSSRH